MKHRFHFSKATQSRVDDFSREQAKKTDLKQEEAVPMEEEIVEKPIETETRTDVGLLRTSNQDAVIAGERYIGIADGMGGHNGGETASAMAKECMDMFLCDREPEPVTLCNAMISVNRRIHMKASESPALSGMGTTLTMLWVGPEMMYIAHVGDSRCYRFRDGELHQVTDDHSLVMEMVRAGMITKEQAAVHPMRNVITRAIGTDDEVEPDLLAQVRKPGDIWLICSDGLHGMVPDDVMTECLKDHTLSEAADLLLKAALDAGGRDNVSLVLLLDREGHDE